MTHLKVAMVYRKMIIDTAVEICALYKGLVKHSMLPSTQINADAENLSLGCPVSGTRYAIGVQLMPEFYPDILPAGEWRFDHVLTTIIDGKTEPLLTAQIFAEIWYNSTRTF